MRTFVINLPRDVKRRLAIEEQLNRLALSFEVVAAVDGRTLSPEKLARNYDDKKFARSQGRAAKLGEIGCALSHIKIYKRMVAESIPYALVLEDDAWLNPNLPEILVAIEEKYPLTEKNVFLLTWLQRFSYIKSNRIWSSYEVVDVKSAVCTHGYVVSFAAAKCLSETLHPVRNVADCWNWLMRHRIVNVRGFIPTCITADLSYQTNISGAHEAPSLKVGQISRLLRKVRRACWYMLDIAASWANRAP